MPSAVLSELPDPPEDKRGWPWTEQSEPLPETQPDGSPWPKISIVTPSYNQGQFIEETIRSILLQGYPNLEYIVMDGGSDDNTVEILEQYDPWIDHWVSEEDGGQADAINKGLSRASGALAAYLNSDDMYLSGALNHIGKVYEKEKFDIFVGRRKTKNNKFFNKFSIKHPRSSLIGYVKQFKPFQEPYWFPQGNYDLPQECVFWSNKKYGNKRFNDKYEFAMDAEWFRRIFSGAKVAYSTKEIGYFRKHPGQKTGRMEKVLQREAEEIDSKYEYCEEKVSKNSYMWAMIKYCLNSINFIVGDLPLGSDRVMIIENEKYI